MTLRAFLSAVFLRSRRDAELDDEIRTHLEMDVRERIARGEDPRQAAYAAQRDFGNGSHVREVTREMWPGGSLERLAGDVGLALRAVRRSPMFALTAVFTLALGIGLTTTIFSVVNGVVLRPLPFPDDRRLMVLCEHYPAAVPDWCGTTPPNVEDIVARSATIAAAGIARSDDVRLNTIDGPETIGSAIATPGAFEALGVKPEMGRYLDRADLRQDAPKVAVISHEFWQARFGGIRDVIGRRIVLDKQAVTIVGVMPPGFRLPELEWAQLWRPVDFDPRDESNRAWPGFIGFVRLKPAVALEAAQADLDRINDGLRREHFATTAGWGITLRPLRDLVLGSTQRSLLLLMAAVMLVLLIACANVANLLLARGTTRVREIALRAALGAGRARLLRGLLLEDLVLSLAGAILGVFLALAGVKLFRGLAPASIPRINEAAVDGRVLAFTLVLSIATTLLFGLIPSWRGASIDPTEGLRLGGRGYTRRTRLGSALVIGELALALVLLSGASLLARTFAAIASWSPGFDESRLVVFSLSTSQANYAHEKDVRGLWNRASQTVRAVPSVVSVGTGSGGPLFGGTETAEVRPSDGSRATGGGAVRWFDVSPGFFGAFGIPILRGRDFDDRDVPGGAPVALINETLARREFAGADPIGKRIVLALNQDVAYQVIGVVRDVPPVRPGTPTEAQLYWSNQQAPRWFTYFVVRTAESPMAAMRSIRDQLKLVDPELRPANVATMTDLLSARLVNPRFMMALLATFGAAALVLAAIGTYGLLAYMVTQRRREIGVRIALGARPRRVVMEVLAGGMRLAITAGVVGIIGSLALGRTLEHLVAGVSTHDPLALASATLVLLGSAFAACAIPALRASRIDPMRVIAAE